MLIFCPGVLLAIGVQNEYFKGSISIGEWYETQQ